MNTNEHYIPKPMDTANVKLPASVLELTDLLAKNAHDVWARQRLAEGWRYGAARNDERKEHPCLVPYEDLPEIEKEYDRHTAMETLKVISLLGFTIEANKKEESK